MLRTESLFPTSVDEGRTESQYDLSISKTLLQMLPSEAFLGVGGVQQRRAVSPVNCSLPAPATVKQTSTWRTTEKNLLVK